MSTVSRKTTQNPATRSRSLAAAPAKQPARIQIDDLAPFIDCGRYRAKRRSGERLHVQATILADGHDIVRAAVEHRGPGVARWHQAPMRRMDPAHGTDRWEGSFQVEAVGRHRWRVLAWIDRFATWRDELERKLAAGQRELDSELAEGALLLRTVLARATAADARLIERAELALADHGSACDARFTAALDPELAAACERNAARSQLVRGPAVEVDVERPRACFGSWYELFPRSWGGFTGVMQSLPQFADLAVDVLYFPPIHPIGATKRKGRDDATEAAPGDPGSPWAIGSAEGGHTAVHPDLGTIDQFDELVARAGELGIEIALDFAIQCSADHPWLVEHPEWFSHRPDGTLKYAENPPKRYQDIYNVDFYCEDWQGLWEALRDVVLFWISHGVRIFRVDNPHTKPLPFWAWLIESVRAAFPDVVFLAEAFTRPPMMRTLAKIGFSQSYTYFTWRNASWELREYMTELTTSGMQEYFRPNFFANTPDILTDYLQHGGPPAFATRLILAATLSPSYGIYSGFEHFENRPRRPGSEEYLESEKYEIKERRLDGPLLPLVSRLNHLRREHLALQRLTNLTFLDTENDALMAYAKQANGELLIVVVTLDPSQPVEGIVDLPESMVPGAELAVRDLLGGGRFAWRPGRNYVRLSPGEAHLLEVVKG